MQRKLNMPILGLFAALEEISATAHDRIVKWGFVAKEKTDRLKQKPADHDKKARRKTVEASRHRNRK